MAVSELAANIRPLIRRKKLLSWAALRFDGYGRALWEGKLEWSPLVFPFLSLDQSFFSAIGAPTSRPRSWDSGA
jgi:hypothetical protein